jgi:hypothetical protein
MENEIEDKRNKWYILRRSIVDYGMGLMYVGFAIVLIFPHKSGFQNFDWDPFFSYMFGSICFLYGAFRIYRGYKKEYYKS